MGGVQGAPPVAEPSADPAPFSPTWIPIPTRNNGVTSVTDDRYDERPDRPAWAAVPTMPWSRVQPSERREDDRGRYRVDEPRRDYDEPTDRPPV